MIRYPRCWAIQAAVVAFLCASKGDPPSRAGEFPPERVPRVWLPPPGRKGLARRLAAPWPRGGLRPPVPLPSPLPILACRRAGA
jgi:hypothetical protein